jgi:hypothetical protein
MFSIKLIYLLNPIFSANQLSCAWKLLGDALSLVECLPESMAKLEIPAKLAQSSDDVILEKWDLVSYI